MKKKLLYFFLPDMDLGVSEYSVGCVQLCVFVHIYLSVGSPGHRVQLFCFFVSSFCNKVRDRKSVV